MLTEINVQNKKKKNQTRQKCTSLGLRGLISKVVLENTFKKYKNNNISNFFQILLGQRIYGTV